MMDSWEYVTGDGTTFCIRYQFYNCGKSRMDKALKFFLSCLLSPIGIPCQGQADLFLGIQKLPHPPQRKSFDKDSLIGKKVIFIAFSDYKIHMYHPRNFLDFLKCR